MVKYELVYFNGRGRAETARQVLAAAGVDYTDTRLQGETWQAFKPDTPFGQLPILKVDGVYVAESLAISRFLARELGLAGATSLNEAKVDMVLQYTDGLFNQIAKAFFEKDEVKKADLERKNKEAIPEGLEHLEKLAGKQYFVGDKVSVADISLYHLIEWGSLDAHLTSYPRLKAIVANVKANPGINAWLEKRPDTSF